MTRTFITILLLIGASLLSIFYIRTQWTDFSFARKEVENLNNISAELDEIIAKRDSLLDAINTISKDDLEKIDKALPKGPRASEFLVTIEQVILRNNLILKRIDVSSLSNMGLENKIAPSSGQPVTGAIVLASKPKPKIIEFPVTLTLSGTYESFKNFLRAIETLLRITTIADISFNSAEKKNTFDFTVRGTTYYQ